MASRPEDRIVCRCFAVPEERIRKAISERSLRQVEEVTAVTRAGGGCSSCWDEIQALLDEVWGRPPGRDVPDASGLSAAQKRARIVAALADGTEALLGLNGIQLQLVDVAGDRVLARFFGDVVGTQAASYLALKKELVRTLSDACGQKMNLVELNVLESLAKAAPTT